MTIVWDKKTISCLGNLVQKYGKTATFSASGVSEELKSELHERRKHYIYRLDYDIDSFSPTHHIDSY